ncbi:unnamed protein product [Polarella glacialis]|uniref:Ion transport domain-containing protein n=1 Tax=Polarella glacialis TaxID=89957 RepID=A0A813IGZ9_POLGL|nr:unnamed protein product [Polarella glacialis]
MSDSSDTPKWVWQNETLAPEAGLAIIVLVYYVVAALLIAISRMCKPLKSSSLTMLTARQRIFIVLQHKNVLQYIDVVQTGMSLWLCLAYIIESYGVVVEWFDTVEKTFNCLFVVDYVLQMFLSQDRLAYLFGFLAFVDVLTIMPLMVTWFIFRSESDTSVVLRIVRLSKLFRILRSFRLIRASSQDIYRELFLLGLTMVCLIFTAAGFYQLIENNWRLARGEPAILPFDQVWGDVPGDH